MVCWIGLPSFGRYLCFESGRRHSQLRAADTMSGICGIIHPSATPNLEDLARTRAALSLPGDRDLQPCIHGSAAMGVAQRWDFQEMSLSSNILVAIDADLVNVESLAADVSGHSDRKHLGGTADLIRELYLRHGLD